MSVKRTDFFSYTSGDLVRHKALVFSSILFGITAAALPAAFKAQPELAEKSTQSLFARIKALDTAMFDAFNNCSDPAQLTRHASYFSADVEFYHDTGGVTWTRDDMLVNTRKFACGNYRRELVPETLEVFPIKDFGAVARGTHRFCAVDTDKCEGIADFVLIWREQDENWQVTRSLSLGHKPNT